VKRLCEKLLDESGTRNEVEMKPIAKPEKSVDWSADSPTEATTAVAFSVFTHAYFGFHLFNFTTSS
jgi:hypothetical protein